MKGWVFVIIGLLMGTTLFLGCTEETSNAIKIKTDLIEAIQSLNSYKLSSDMTMDMTITNSSGTITQGTLMTLTGEIDIEYQKLKIESITTSAESGEIFLYYYIVDGIMYGGQEIGGEVTWTSQDLSLTGEENLLNTWYSQSQLEGQINQVLDNADVRQLDDESVNGDDCFVLKVIPNFESEQANPYGIQISDDPSGMFQEMDVKYWISKDTNLLVKAYTKMIMDMSWMFALFGGEIDSVIYDMEITQTYYDFNVPVTIEVPAEAIPE